MIPTGVLFDLVGAVAQVRALDDLAETLRRRFLLVGESTDAVLRAYDGR